MIQKSGMAFAAFFIFTINSVEPAESQIKAKSQPTSDLAVVGPICFADGIGRQSIGIIDCLKNDLVIKFVHTRGARELNLKDVPDEVKNIILTKRSGTSNVAILEDVLSNGNPAGPEYYYKKMPRAKIKLAYTMFESSEIQREWVDILNNHFDAAIVPDQFLVSVYKNSGVTIPIFVVPLGIYMNELLKLPLKKEVGPVFTFGFSGAFTDRKNHGLILEAFAHQFGNDPRFRLRLHGRSGDALYESLRARVNKLGLHNVEIIRSSFSWQEYVDFMQSLDCYVSLSKGEGFAIPPREAMALGLPCIISDNTAHHTICESGLVFGVRSDILSPAYYEHLNATVGYDFNCSVKDVSKAMHHVYTQYEHYLENAHKCRIWAQQYLYENLRPLYLSMVKPKEVVLGQTDVITADYLMTGNKRLYEKYLGLQSVQPSTEEEKQVTEQTPAEITYDTLNPTCEVVSDADIIGAYRVMAGVPIPLHDFNHFKKLKDGYGWSLTHLAHHFLAMLPVQEHLKLPSLQSVAHFPIALNNGMTLFGFETDLFIAHSIAQTGYWEPELEAVMRRVVAPGDTVLDIGANIGYFTAILAECVGAHGNVHAIEALAPLYELIKKSRSHNGWNNVHIYNCALGDKKDSVFFLINSINPGGSCIISPAEAAVKMRVRPQSVIKVHTDTLDDLLLTKGALARVDYIKMDVEGAEDAVLRGAQKLIAKYKPKMTIEFSPIRYRMQGIDPVGVLRRLQDMGYSFQTISVLAAVQDPIKHVLSNPRDPQELVDWIDAHAIEHVDLLLVPRIA